MLQDKSSNNKRIAKNTILLYFRTFLTMFVGLFTSRVILNTLGIDDYGVYNVIGGVVAMFTLFTGSLSTAISRFLAIGLGMGNQNNLKNIFSTSVTIQIVLAVFVAILCEIGGVWFLNSQLNIPVERMEAANWVLHFSILTFCVNLLSVPYNAAIIAHERMDAFAYISIVEVLIKLLVAYSLYVSPLDKLITYGGLLAGVSILMRCIYGIYCRRSFEECHYKFVLDKCLLKEMTGFAGWNFFGAASVVFYTQGVSIVMNLFFGVVYNAARGVATQVEGIIKGFVNNFTTAINPQIMKSYAASEIEYTFKLVNTGSKFTCYLMLIFMLPFMFEAEKILELWLGVYPPEAPLFLRLTLIGTIVDLSGNALANAVWATGNIKKYYVIIGTSSILVLPITYLLYLMGLPAYYCYVVYIIVYLIVQVQRLFIARSQMGFPIRKYVTEVAKPVVIVTLLSLIVPISLCLMMDDSYSRMFIVALVSVTCTVITIYLVGLSVSEKNMVTLKLMRIIPIISRKK